jgi:hypothetical protein
MLGFDLDKVRENARGATTEDLLDRVTVYRPNMEPEALEVIEAELQQRGVTPAAVAAHGAARENAAYVTTPSGLVLCCTYCREPAVAERWGFHWLWGLIPLLPRRFHYCREHLPEADAPPAGQGDTDDPAT